MDKAGALHQRGLAFRRSAQGPEFWRRLPSDMPREVARYRIKSSRKAGGSLGIPCLSIFDKVFLQSPPVLRALLTSIVEWQEAQRAFTRDCPCSTAFVLSLRRSFCGDRRVSRKRVTGRVFAVRRLRICRLSTFFRRCCSRRFFALAAFF